jgi:hypothetical protein
LTGEVIVGHAMWQVLTHGHTFIPVNVGVYGASESGKTTLDQQFTTRGEIRHLDEDDRTHHKPGWRGILKMPDATKKRIKSNGMKKTIVTRDLGGHTEYHSMWLRDMIQRKVSTVIVVIDHRHMSNSKNIDNQLALSYLVDSLGKSKVPKGLSFRAWWRAKKYAPKRIILLANKADEWMDEECHMQWEKGFIARHKIFNVFREDLYRLQKMNIPVVLDAISARYGWNIENSVLRGLQL